MDGLNISYGVKMEGAVQSYPAVQATCYQPRTASEKVDLCFSEESFELLSEQAKVALNPRIITVNFGDEDCAVMVPCPDLRFVILGKPKMLCLDKETGDVSPLVKGLRLAGTKKVTATKLIMAAVVGDTVLDAEDGTPQVFTLKLTSNKTSLVDGDREDKDSRSLNSLNNSLLKHYKLRGMWLGHLVSVQLGARPEKFVSKASGQSSLGIRFDFVGGARPLPDAAQQRMGLLAQSDEVQGLLKNPFSGGNAAPSETTEEFSVRPSYDDEISVAENLYNQLIAGIETAPDCQFLEQLEAWWNANSRTLGNWKAMGDRALFDAYRHRVA